MNIEKILIGQQNGYSLEDWVKKTKEYDRLSVLIKDSPYVRFLQDIENGKGRIDDREFLENTDYYKMAKVSIDYCGLFFEAKNYSEILIVMKRFYSMYQNFNQDHSSKKDVVAGHSQKKSPIIVNKIFFSDCYEVVDGHHRLAILYMLKNENVKVIVQGNKKTYLQKLALDYGQTTKDPELYQPVDKEEFRTWRVVRRCDDRFKMISDFFESNNLFIKGETMLDISCSYGWFLKAFRKKGFRVLGVDKDRNCLELGRIAYGLKKEELIVGDGVKSIDGFIKNKKQFYVVTFLSILHHFAIGKEKGSVEEIVKKIDKITKRVLVIDTGQAHEDWYAESLSDWDDDYIEDLLMKNTNFKNIYRLGKDSDNRGEYDNQYQRTLFVCLK